MSELIKPSEEPAVRLVVFTAALLTISARQNVLFEAGTMYMVPETILPSAVAEARAIADAVVAEAKRLSAPYVCTDCLATPDDTGKVQHKHGCSHEYIRG